MNENQGIERHKQSVDWEPYKFVNEMVERHGWTFRAVAQHIGVSESRVSEMWHKYRRHLKEPDTSWYTGLPTRIYNQLRCLDIGSLDDLEKISYLALRHERRMTDKAISELAEWMAKQGKTLQGWAEVKEKLDNKKKTKEERAKKLLGELGYTIEKPNA